MQISDSKNTKPDPLFNPQSTVSAKTKNPKTHKEEEEAKTGQKAIDPLATQESESLEREKYLESEGNRPAKEDEGEARVSLSLEFELKESSLSLALNLVLVADAKVGRERK